MIERDEQLDALLEEHFRQTLDGQLGRAPAAVERHIARQRTMVFRLAAGGSALAACLVVALLVMVSLRRGLPPKEQATNPQTDTTQPVVASDIRLERTVYWVNEDLGTVVLEDNTPARRVRQAMVERVVVYDGDQPKSVEMTVPNEQVVYVPLNPY